MYVFLHQYGFLCMKDTWGLEQGKVFFVLSGNHTRLNSSMGFGQRVKNLGLD